MNTDLDEDVAAPVGSAIAPPLAAVSKQPPADRSAPAGVPVARTTLEYDKSANRVSRRQMNLLLLFVAVDTVLFAGFVCLPAVQPAVRDWLAQYQHRRDERRWAESVRAKLAACLTEAAPADRVVYSEEADGALKLITSDARARMLPWPPIARGPNGAAYQSARVDRAARAAQFQAPVMWGRNDAFQAWVAAAQSPMIELGGADAPVFVHAMRTPGGQERLVAIFFGASQVLQELPAADESGGGAGSGSGRRPSGWELQTERALRAFVFDPQRLPSLAPQTIIRFTEPAAGRPRLVAEFQGPASRNDDSNVSVATSAVTGLRPWQVFAGQPDPADPTHLTIAYDIAGVPGVIDGRLTDGERLMMTPRTGRNTGWTGTSEYGWDLGALPPPPGAPATSQPATKPSGPRDLPRVQG
jgi:hypothetical protein